MHDVTERQRLHEKLLHQAHHDALTDLPTRELFEQQLEEALKIAQQSGTKLAVLCIDFDRFKQINDSYGHAAGDLCLKQMTTRINARLDGRGTLARSGGDEFMLFVKDLREAGEAELFAGEVLADLRAPMDLGAGELEMGASVGFAIYPDDGAEADQLWRDADAAMYQAKRAGGGQWVRVSDEISSSASQANEIEQALRRALKTGNLQVHYQPQMLLDGRFHSMEALLRSQDPVLRGTPVDRIISIAEESGLIVALGNWVLEEVCRQCRAWRDEGLSPLQVGVNVSPLQLTRFDFSRQVAKTLSRHELSARVLEFEVTESTVMPEHGGGAPHQIATLSRMGIRFSIDDFGKGYSSLGRLHQLPVESLKIDQAFVRRITDMNGTFPTVEAIIVLAHTFGMKVVAEGVETEAQLKLLRSLGCDRVQGFLFSRPLAADAATNFLREMQEESICQSVA
jgi:diguanylate cyclase (GGDEF)-like protein